MSWNLNAVGTPEHLREYIRRHVHHYWQDMEAIDRGVIAHALGHALRALDVATLHTLVAGGHDSGAEGYQLHVEVHPVRPTPLPPPVPDEAAPNPAPEASA